MLQNSDFTPNFTDNSENESINTKNNKLLQGLNNKQLEAATTITGSVLVIAGAGSGKTSVLTKRVAYLIQQQVKPGSILCVTFTNKAAAEMNNRVRKLLIENDINLPFVPAWQIDYTQSPLLSTFHSLGVRILREFGEKLGLKKEFNILDTDDQKKLVSRILKELNVDQKNLQPKTALFFISQCKQEMLSARDSRKLSRDFLPVFHQIYKRYEEELRQSHLVDFDDLLLLTYQLLCDYQEVRTELQNRWHHVMVDEFQDTNQIQFEIIRLLMPPNRLKSTNSEDFSSQNSTSLFVVGDDAQSIYAFRGSKIDIILNFGQEYPGCVEIILNQNYRSTQPILDLAENILTHNPKQKKKDLFTTNPEKIDVHYYLARNEKDEAEFIVRTLHKLYQGSNKKEPDQEKLENNDAQDDDQNPASKLKMPNFSDNQASDQENEFYEEDVVLDISEGNLNSDEIVEIYSQKSSQDNLQAKNSKNGKMENDEFGGISAMFDLHLESDDFNPYKTGTGSSSFSQTLGIAGYKSNSWQVPAYNFKQMPKLNEVVVLYRTHSQSRAIEEMFLNYHVPYRLVSGTKFLDRREIKDVLAMLKYLSNGEDKISLSRFLPLLMDGVGPKTLQKIMAYLEDFDFPLPPKIAQQVLELFSKLQSVWLQHDNLVDLTKELVVVSGYARYLKQEFPAKEDFDTKMENIGELYSLMFSFDQDKTTPLSTRLMSFLEHVGLMSQQEANETDMDEAKVNLMSLHQSKGLEFESVFLIGCEDGILPHQNSFLEEKGMEEEVRLAYVGVTRAKKHLYLISADSRVQFGQIKANPVSRIIRPFLDNSIKRVVK